MPGMGGGMSRGGAMMPGMGGQQGGGGGFSAPPGGGMGGGFGAMGPRGDLARGAQKVKELQGRLWRLQSECSGGDGLACNHMQIVQQQLQQAQSQQQQYIGIAQAGMDRGTMGTNGRGRRGADPNDLAARTLGAMYGPGGIGGMGGGW